MITLMDIAKATLNRDDFQLRCLVQALWREKRSLNEYPQPKTTDPRILSVAAGIVELLAKQWQQVPPDWTKHIGAMPEPFFIPKYADEMKNLRHLCETESPESLRKRGLYAPPNFLEFA
jgi:hypothetical protein